MENQRHLALDSLYIQLEKSLDAEEKIKIEAEITKIQTCINSENGDRFSKSYSHHDLLLIMVLLYFSLVKGYINCNQKNWKQRYVQHRTFINI